MTDELAQFVDAVGVLYWHPHFLSNDQNKSDEMLRNAKQVATQENYKMLLGFYGYHNPSEELVVEIGSKPSDGTEFLKAIHYTELDTLMWNGPGKLKDLPKAIAIAKAATDKVYKGYPKTPEEWWAILDKWFDPEFLDLAYKYMDSDSVELFKTAKEEKLGQKVVECLNKIWMNAPDSLGIHSLPGWNVLCDLASESYLIEMNEEELKAFQNKDIDDL